MLILFGIAFVVSWNLEPMSIATGIPFGHYHYTGELGPMLGTVPLLIMPGYVAVCYATWNLAYIVLNKSTTAPTRCSASRSPSSPPSSW